MSNFTGYCGKLYCKGLSLQRLAGYEIPADSTNLKLIMVGIQVDLMKPANQAVQMTLQILKEISEFVNFNNEYEIEQVHGQRVTPVKRVTHVYIICEISMQYLY